MYGLKGLAAKNSSQSLTKWCPMEAIVINQSQNCYNCYNYCILDKGGL